MINLTGTSLMSYRLVDASHKGTHATIYGVAYEVYFNGKWHFLDNVTSIYQEESEAIVELTVKACKRWNLKKETITINFN